MAGRSVALRRSCNAGRSNTLALSSADIVADLHMCEFVTHVYEFVTHLPEFVTHMYEFVTHMSEFVTHIPEFVTHIRLSSADTVADLHVCVRDSRV